MYQVPGEVSRQERFAKPLFLATVVTGSFLLFLTQPMIARMALPRLGGAPAVWNSAMLVYQALLLAGYAYAHALSRLSPIRQAGLHLALFAIAALWLPIGIGAAIPPTDFPATLWVPWFLLSAIGPLFFIISAQAPLMQRWYALESRRGDPYPLYAASNLGSFTGLISYPLIVEPLLTLEQQSLVWTAGYALLLLMVAGCALMVPGRVVERRPERLSPPPGWRRIGLWIALAAIPSGLMLSTTTHLTTDIVAMPLLWVVPLGLYLLSFVVAFAERRKAARAVGWAAPLILLVAGGLAFASGMQRPILAATLGLVLLFAVAVALHSEMVRLRPAPDRLTDFYLAMAFGGVLGGAFCALAAPMLFDWAYEHPLLLLAAAALIPRRSYFGRIEKLWADPVRARSLALLLPALALLLSLWGDRHFTPQSTPTMATVASILVGIIALLCIGRRWAFVVCLGALMLSYGGWSTLALSVQQTRSRSYFGIYTVIPSGNGTARMLTHGTTIHGIQNVVPGKELEPTSYYTRKSGVGRAMSAAPKLYGPAARIGVVGLGTGTLACYRRPGQSWTFFEIDPAMVRIATDPRRFSFLARCAPGARIELGDARLKLAEGPAARFDILAIDAFSSDAVPMHLLTREALRVYRRALRPGGLLLIHISNRYIDLEPVLAVAAQKDGWSAAVHKHQPDERKPVLNDIASVWVAMARDDRSLDDLIAEGGPTVIWEVLDERPGFDGWTDDHASILPLLEGWTE